MKSLVFFELKKIFGARKALVCAAVVLMLLGVAFFGRAVANDLFEKLPDIRQALGAQAGELRPERFAEAERRHGEILNDPDSYYDSDGEWVMKPEVAAEFDALEPILALRNMNAMPRRETAELEGELADPETSPSRALLIQKNIDMFSKKGNLTKGYNLFYDYYNGFLTGLYPYLMGFLILLFITPVFTGEYSSGMDGLTLSSKRGKRGLIGAKLLASAVSVTAVYVFVMGLYILLCGAVLGFSGGETSLATMYSDGFQYLSSPYDLTMFQFLLISLGISYLACMGFAAFTLFVSARSTNVLTVFAICAVVFYVPLLASALSGDLGGSFPPIANALYGPLVQVTPLLERFHGFVVLGNVVMLKDLSLSVLVVTSALFGFLAWHSFKRRQVAN
jgi:ABC-type transport system involved in multi-copper enzyme maturation permease subunit